MNRGISLVRPVAVALIAIAAAVTPVAASGPSPVTIVLVQNADTYETLGWSATWPTFSDSGGWSVDRLVIGGPPTLLFGIVETTQTSSARSFRLDFHGGTTPVGSVAAPWRLYAGTGVYKTLKGNGVWTQAYIPAPDPNTPALLIFTLSGSVH